MHENTKDAIAFVICMILKEKTPLNTACSKTPLPFNANIIQLFFSLVKGFGKFFKKYSESRFFHFFLLTKRILWCIIFMLMSNGVHFCAFFPRINGRYFFLSGGE